MLCTDEFNEDWLQEIKEDAFPDAIAGSNSSVGSGNDIRNTLMEYFSHNSLLPP